MTRGLGWETSYQPMDKVFPQATFEGIKIHDWDKREDPFRLDHGRLLKYQAEKERKFMPCSMPSPRTTATSASPMRVT